MTPTGMTLTDDEKAHLRAEEEFRVELRRQFGERKPSRWWTFLNSAFVLWFLGSVSLVGLTALYHRLDSSSKANIQRAEMQRKITEELRERFAVAGYSQLLDKSNSCNAESDQTPTPELTDLVLTTINGDSSGVYEEFRHTSANEMFSRLFKPGEQCEGLPESEIALCAARTNWRYLEPKLWIRKNQPQIDVKLTCRELFNRLDAIHEKLN